MIYVSGDIEGIRTMCTVEVFVAGFSEEKPDGAISIRRLWGELVEERYKTGVKRIFETVSPKTQGAYKNVPVSSSFSFPYINDMSS